MQPRLARLRAGIGSRIAVWAVLAAAGLPTASIRSTEIDYVRQVQPLLAAKCYACHGPDADARQADLRLDQRAAAIAASDDRAAAVVPGHPDQSALLHRVRSSDPDLRMPPPDAGQPLSEQEVSLLRQWIAEGAHYEQHWSFRPLQKPSLPAVEDRAWVRNEIDYFVLAQLEARGLRPSPPASPERLLRRTSMDLLGLLPTLPEADAYLDDHAPNAYERLVDRLLASPYYGERKALVWLDLARFADSGGYQGDILREMWPWRDWVIDAYNRNLPFDQFTIEQLAGDRLSNPSQSQLIATGFNRNHRINDEDGIIHEEFRVEYVADRLETTAAVWMGLTIGCARCHDHKYDPISQREYYSLFAFFNSVDEDGRGHGNSPPLLDLPTPEQQSELQELDRRLQALRATESEASEGAGEKAGEGASASSLAERIAELSKQREQLQKRVTSTMVMRDLPAARDTFVLIRGAYDRRGETVAPAVPAVLPPLVSEGSPDRLDLARWLLRQDHPLTARVTVNRIWQHHFGRGLVATPEDFGTRGELPSHPELLDWLAVEFMRSGWDVKRLHRLICCSATYRQSSRVTARSLELDPENRWLSRGPRDRLPGELIRDQVLQASGLLVNRQGGPSAKPYQPPGLWEELASATRSYPQDTGAGLYRRSLYTFWRRTIPPPSMIAFDAPNREICQVRRARSNTPLQALVLLNSPIFFEAARNLAEQVIGTQKIGAENSPDDDGRLEILFRKILVRRPDAAELRVLQRSLGYFRDRFASDPTAAAELLTVGESRPDDRIDVLELAAWTCVANLVLNLDEVVTKE